MCMCSIRRGGEIPKFKRPFHIRTPFSCTLLTTRTWFFFTSCTGRPIDFKESLPYQEYLWSIYWVRRSFSRFRSSIALYKEDAPRNCLNLNLNLFIFFCKCLCFLLINSLCVCVRISIEFVAPSNDAHIMPRLDPPWGQYRRINVFNCHTPLVHIFLLIKSYCDYYVSF